MFQSKTTVWAAVLIAIVTFSSPGIGKAQAPGADQANVAGRWRGTRSATGGSGMDALKTHSIQFDLTENGADLSGSYKCFAGKKANTDCNNPVGNLTGGKLEGDQVKMQVQSMPNNLECTFEGKLKGSKMNGLFTCYSGGGLTSNGSWTVHRVAAEQHE